MIKALLNNGEKKVYPHRKKTTVGSSSVVDFLAEGELGEGYGTNALSNTLASYIGPIDDINCWKMKPHH